MSQPNEPPQNSGETVPENEPNKGFNPTLDVFDKLIGGILIIGAIVVSIFGALQGFVAMIITGQLTVSIVLYDVFRHARFKSRWYCLALCIVVLFVVPFVAWKLTRQKAEATVAKINTPDTPQDGQEKVTPQIQQSQPDLRNKNQSQT